MAERRMFAKSIVLSDAFLDMPLGARCLYMTMGMMADDDGFVNNAKSIIRITGASEDDLRVLISKKFILPFEDGVIVIKHWRINNYLRNDRYQETKYIEDKARLLVDEKGAYTYTEKDVGIPSSGIPRLGKDRLGKDSIGKVSIGKDNNINEINNINNNISNTPYSPPTGGKTPKKPSSKDMDKLFRKMIDETDLSDYLKTKLNEWLDYKKEIRNSYKAESGFKQFLTIFSKYTLSYSDDEIADVINRTMAAGYKGIVWDWLNKPSKVSQSVGNDPELNNFYNMAANWAAKGE